MTVGPRTAESRLERLIDELHTSRLRVWSIVVSFFGDAVNPRGGLLWLSAFRPLASRLRIESGTLGAAMSRLTADGWLIRDKRGRHTLYRLDPSGKTVFDEATDRIYGLLRPRAWNGKWTIAIVPNGETPSGFARIDERTWVRPGWTPDDTREPAAPGVVFKASTDASPALQALVADAWNLDEVGAAYDRWRTRFVPLSEALAQGAPLSPLSAMCARVLLVHGFRRVVLKDPALPESLIGPRWPGCAARRQAESLYRALLPASEAWLDAPNATPEGPFPRPDARFYKRFGGLR